MLRVENLSYHIDLAGSDPLVIVDDVNFSLDSADSLAITGDSGSGKTTLLGLLAGLNSPTSGNIYLSDVCTSDMNEDQRALFRAKNVGFVFQSFYLLKHLTALENVLLPLQLGGHSQAREKALDLLEKVGLNHRIHHKPTMLSGGEQQRVAIARAFANQPKYLFADEPTGNLDHKTADKVSDLLFELNEQHGTTLILVTHANALAKRCHTHLQLQAGKLVVTP